MDPGVLKAKELISQLSLVSDHAESALTSLKIAGRDATTAQAVFDDNAIKILEQYATKNNTESVRCEALRVIANALLLVPGLRGAWDIGFAAQYIESSVEEEFLVGRVLFLSTIEKREYKPAVLRTIQEYIIQHLSSCSKRELTSVSLNGLKETCKLLFNILLHTPVDSGYNDAVVLLVEIVKRLPHSFDSTMSAIVSCLLKLPILSETYYPENSTSTVELFLEILEDAVTSPSRTDDTLMVLLAFIYELSAHASPTAKTYILSKIFPQDSEREAPLGKSHSLASRLLQTTSDPALPKSTDLIFQIMWENSNQDVGKFVYNIGLGYALGFLMKHNIPIPDDLRPENSMNHINPVTGQRLDSEIPALDDMTDEEKEREAERLFVLFERIRENGVIKVENPVRTAVESGRFEELP